MNWAIAFARQAESDLAVRDYLLENERLSQCHQLHYLQMALEKLAKAHILAGGGGIRPVHGYIGKHLPIMVSQMLRKSRGEKDAWVIDAVRVLAQRVERLAPAVDAGGTVPSNCEYPWRTPNGKIASPLDYDFGLHLLRERAGLIMLKAARARLAEILSDPAVRT